MIKGITKLKKTFWKLEFSSFSVYLLIGQARRTGLFFSCYPNWKVPLWRGRRFQPTKVIVTSTTLSRVGKIADTRWVRTKLYFEGDVVDVKNKNKKIKAFHENSIICFLNTGFPLPTRSFGRTRFRHRRLRNSAFDENAGCFLFISIEWPSV